MFIVNDRIQIPDDQLQFTFVRSSGPGGQNVNKVNSKAVMRWAMLASNALPADIRERFRTRYGARLTVEGELLITSAKYRDQGRNVDDCLEKLRAMLLAVAVPPKVRRPTKPTAGAKRRRLANKQLQSKKKESRRS